MQRPQDGPVHPAQGLKKQRQIQIAPVQVMQVDHIGTEAFQLPDESHRSKYTSVALRIQQLSRDAVQLALPGKAYAIRVGLRLWRDTGHAVADSARAAIRLHQPGDFQRDAARAFDPAIGVELKDPHPISLPQAK